MSTLESLSDLFDLVGCQVTFYDMGRHVTKITPQQVNQFDRLQRAYPFPFRQQAWMAIVMQEKRSPSEPVIWFIHLPLDEKGSLNLGTRDHLIKSITDRILRDTQNPNLENALEDNPYAFQPDPERMASFHAKLSLQLKTSPSSYFSDLQHYLSSLPEEDDSRWQQIGLQGIADLAVRHSETSSQTLILSALKHAHPVVIQALCKALEHEKPGQQIIDAIIERLMQTDDQDFKAAMVRGLSQTPLSGEQRDLYIQWLNTNSDDVLSVAIAIAAKATQWLTTNPALLHALLEYLAARDDGFTAFRQVVSEFNFLPEIRSSMWQYFRSEQRSIRMAQAIGSLFAKAPGQVQ